MRFPAAARDRGELLNASVLTELRTPAVTAVATETLARPDAADVTIFGLGVQGKAHLRTLAAVRSAGIVVTATNAVSPLLRHPWLRPGTHVNAVGSCVPHTREPDTATMASARVFADSLESATHEAGLAIQDLAAARFVYARAEETGVGTRVEY